jgi:ABC-type multidrug transport system ATPase subunit
MLKNLKKQGITILVSTPYMDEASLCDRVALIQKGEILRINTPTGIIEQFGKPIWAVKSDKMYQMLHELRDWEQVKSAYPFGEYDHVVIEDPKTLKKDIINYLEKKKHTGIVVENIEPTIEDCFMDLMKIQN